MSPTDWSALHAELAVWRSEGRTLPLWWRDDDAIAPTPELERLQTLAQRHAIPVHLAIIPAHASPGLADALDTGAFRAVVHGWAHENHAPEGMKSSEFGAPRETAADDAARGLKTLDTLFPGKVQRMFVPPWNRIDDALLPQLRDTGYTALSTYLPRTARFPVPGLEQINTHIDPVDWRGTRGLRDPNDTLDQLVTTLRDRRNGQTDASEPLGLLTHHLMQDDATWDFTHAILTELCEGPVELFDIATRKDTQ